MNIFVRNIDYDNPQDELPEGGVVEFEDDVSDDLSLEEYGRDAWLFLESEIGQTIKGFEASFDEDFADTAYQFVKNEAGDGFIIYDMSQK
ncbi:MAG: hypothetical protein ACON49_08830 [Candidatus Puniceispirillaceae bacterium]